MKKMGVYSLALCLCLIGINALAMEVYFSHSIAPESLHCPNSSNANKPNSTPKPKKEASVEDVPMLEEVNTYFAENNIAEPLDTRTGQVSARIDTWKRIGIWGDSHAAANFFSEALTKAMGLDSQTVLPGFISPFVGNASVRLPLRKVCKGNGWKMEHAYVNRNPNAKWSRALTRLRSQTQNAYLWIDFRSPQLTNTFKALYIRLTQGLNNPENANALVRLSVNGAPAQVLDINTAQEHLLNIASDSPIATLQLEVVAGSIGIEGFIPHYDTNPKFMVDTFGIPGATAKGFQFMEGSLEDGEDPWPLYDLVITEFGTNEGNNLNFNNEAYEKDLQKSLTVLRQKYPNAACVLIGPTDRGIFVPRSRLMSKKVCTVTQEKGKNKKKGKKKRVCKIVPPPKIDMLPYARIHETISQTQAKIAPKFGCQAWSWQEAMGGKGGIYRWLYRKPSLAQRDLIHLTAEGYRHSANLFAQKLWEMSGSNNAHQTENALRTSEE